MYTTCCCIHTPDIFPWGINKLKGNDVFGKRVVRAQVEFKFHFIKPHQKDLMPFVKALFRIVQRRKIFSVCTWSI